MRLSDTSGAEAEPSGAEELSGFFQHEWPLLLRFLLRQGASWDEAQDAAQIAFGELWRSRGRVARPAAWLRTVAWRAHLKSAVAIPEQAVQDLREQLSTRATHWQSPVDAIEIGEQERQVLKALSGLPDKQRRAMAWRLDGFTTAEIAAEMSCSEAAVLQNISRARAALKQQLGLSREGEGART